MKTVWASVLILTATAVWTGFSLADGGCGLTWDEPWYVQAGALYTGLLDVGNTPLQSAWAYNHEHPPLAKVLMGVGQHVALLVTHPTHPPDVLLLGARATVLALFGLMLVGLWVFARPLGFGIAAGAVLLATACPRLLGHAQLATLDLPLVCFWVWALAALERATRGALRETDRGEPNAEAGWQPPQLRRLGWGLAACLLGGAAFLTKFSGIALLGVVLLWPLLVVALQGTPQSARLAWRFRGVVRALFVGLAWTLAAAAVVAGLLVACWPWLWEETGARLSVYVAGSLAHAMTPVLYLGEVYGAGWEGAPPPWHYAPVMLLVTLPVFVSVGAIAGAGSVVCGLLASRRSKALASIRPGGQGGEAALCADPTDPQVQRTLLLAALGGAALPVASMLPGTAAYDGIRLFLPAVPLLCVLAAVGWMRAGLWLGRRLMPVRDPVRAATALLLVLGLGGTVFGRLAVTDDLGYYTLAIGGPAGAERLGLQTSYWSTGFTPRMRRILAARVARHAGAAEPLRVWFAGFGGLAPSFLRGTGRVPANVRAVNQAPWDLAVVVHRRSLPEARALWDRLDAEPVPAGTEAEWFAEARVWPAAPVRILRLRYK